MIVLLSLPYNSSHTFICNGVRSTGFFPNAKRPGSKGSVLHNICVNQTTFFQNEFRLKLPPASAFYSLRLLLLKLAASCLHYECIRTSAELCTLVCACVRAYVVGPIPFYIPSERVIVFGAERTNDSSHFIIS